MYVCVGELEAAGGYTSFLDVAWYQATANIVHGGCSHRKMLSPRFVCHRVLLADRKRAQHRQTRLRTAFNGSTASMANALLQKIRAEDSLALLLFTSSLKFRRIDAARFCTPYRSLNKSFYCLVGDDASNSFPPAAKFSPVPFPRTILPWVPLGLFTWIEKLELGISRAPITRVINLGACQIYMITPVLCNCTSICFGSAHLSSVLACRR